MTEEKACGKSSTMDITQEADLAYAVTNLIEAEEHLTISAAQNPDKSSELMEFVKPIAELRAKWLEKLVPKVEGTQLYCSSKHLLSSHYRFLEVASKAARIGDSESAKNILSDAKDVFDIVMLLKRWAEKSTNQGVK